ncbi:hypothetical protein BD779DRAFT_1472274 [Infundibulicybe gibba]|nr:hypothetical protein BD779DRAFT_1472274 [Infundibulicybe gibba]
MSIEARPLISSPRAMAEHHSQKSENPYGVPHETFHEGITFNQLHGHSNGDGLTCGTFTVRGDPQIATDNPYGIVGTVTKGILFLSVSSAPNDRHEFKEGQVFHITKGSTFKWAAGPYGEGTESFEQLSFYAVAKPIDHEVSKLDLKRPVF